jgi:proteasome accessory factor B
MPSKISKRERLMNLIALLFASRTPVPFRDIVGRVVGYDDGASVDALDKRFERDKADLRILGIPITYRAQEGETDAGYVVDQNAVFQEKVTFSPQESLLLSIAGRVGSAATGGGALEEALKSALRKLAVDTVGIDPFAEMAPVTVLRMCSGDPLAQINVAVFTDAITEGQSVSFLYHGQKDEAPKERKVDPYGLGLVRGAWFVVGFCHLRQEVRTFRVSRIEGKVTLLLPTHAFHVPDSFDVEDYLKSEAWDMGTGRPVVVTVAVKADVLPLQGSSPFKFLRREGEWAIHSAEVKYPRALLPWILSSRGSVRALEPSEFLEEVLEHARKALARYLAPAEQSFRPEAEAEAPR